MNKKLDLRARVTIKLLTDTLFELMQQKPFEEISVIDICKSAQVNRSTFYNRFDDKQQLLEQLLCELQEKFESRCAPAKQNVYKREYYLGLYEQILKDIAEHRKFYEKGVLSAGTYVQSVFTEAIVSYLITHFEKSSEHNALPYTVPIPVIAEYYAGAFTSLAVWWIRDGLKTPIKTMMTYANELTGRGTVCP